MNSVIIDNAVFDGLHSPVPVNPTGQVLQSPFAKLRAMRFRVVITLLFIEQLFTSRFLLPCDNASISDS